MDIGEKAKLLKYAAKQRHRACKLKRELSEVSLQLVELRTRYGEDVNATYTPAEEFAARNVWRRHYARACEKFRVETAAILDQVERLRELVDEQHVEMCLMQDQLSKAAMEVKDIAVQTEPVKELSIRQGPPPPKAEHAEQAQASADLAGSRWVGIVNPCKDSCGCLCVSVEAIERSRFHPSRKDEVVTLPFDCLVSSPGFYMDTYQRKVHHDRKRNGSLIIIMTEMPNNKAKLLRKHGWVNHASRSDMAILRGPECKNTIHARQLAGSDQ